MSKTICYCLAVSLAFRVAATWGAEPPAEILGANSCASTSCHGGGGANQDQFLIWSLQDFHSQRPVAALATARAKEIADAAGIADPTSDDRCTSCHAPLREVPEALRGKNFNVAEGVTCESCHGPAGNWIRSHTRTDYTRADCTAAGMRDLQDLYVRANTCVACHQVVAEPLLQAGHPELIFELDGQSVAEPKHWSVAKNGNGAQAWFVGQAVALREVSWELEKQKLPAQNQIDSWRGLVWLMVRSGKIDPRLPAPPDITFRPNFENFEQVQKWSDALAHAGAELSWTDQMTQAALVSLAGTSPDFRASVPQPVQARRAERLVLALDRLFGAQKSPQANHELDELFKLSQSRPDFDPAAFAVALDKFSQTINPL
ncbi:MAG TPA: multiheme c-type cytochrome [Verrucomicrobiae bacterium]|nr:multiheme c-type cytochrome [Verrucomicrobiae bacterium]